MTTATIAPSGVTLVAVPSAELLSILPGGRRWLEDVEAVGRLTRPGSVVVVTVQAAAKRGERLSALQQNLPATRLPYGLTEETLIGPWTFADVQYEALKSAFTNVVSLRPDESTAEQLIRFHYSDDAQMQTIAWIVSNPEVAPRVASCMFDSLAFTSPDEARLLEVPVLTRKELAHLNALLPLKPKTTLKDKIFPEAVLAKYPEVYRYYPHYVSIA